MKDLISSFTSYSNKKIIKTHSGVNDRQIIFLSLITLFLFLSHHCEPCQSYLKFTAQSCVDLIPRNKLSTESRHNPSNSRFPSAAAQPGFGRRKKRSEIHTISPYKLVVSGKRYRRHSDLIVRVEGDTFEGLMIQARAVAGPGGELIRGGIGLVGQFGYLPFSFIYIPCHDSSFSTVSDNGNMESHANVSFIWTSPEHDSGNVRFIASVMRGIHYWIIVSDILIYNPFPITSDGCGKIYACFRICPYGSTSCGPRDARYFIKYNIDFVEKREIQITMGGQLRANNTFLGVAFGQDYHRLSQADLTVCYLERGRVTLDHLLIEDLNQAPYRHHDVLTLDDSDVDGKMLWCRFRRPLVLGSIIDPKLNLYHFYFRGELPNYNQEFKIPRRHEIFSSAFKRNFSTVFNEIESGSRINLGSNKIIEGCALIVFIVIFRYGA